MARFEEYYCDNHNHAPASGIAKAGLTTGIVGSTIAGILGLNALSANNGAHEEHCNEQILVNRYEMDKEHDYMILKAENSILKAEKESDRKSLELFKYFNGKLEGINQVLAQQAIQNQKTADSFTILRGHLDAETQARCCADNTIVNYANNTFYPMEIAALEVKPDLTRTKRVYNPLPGECFSNGCECR